MSDRVAIALQDGVADVRLNRPDKLNALDREMFQAIVDAGDRLRDDPDVRVVVLSGEGRAFCAGLDLAAFAGALGGATPGEARPPVEGVRPGNEWILDRLPGRITNLFQEVAHQWHDLPAPVIAAVHGACFGGGIQIALGADLRLVHPDAQLSVMEVRWGIPPDMTGTQMLPRLVGLDVAKELTFTGRRVGGEEAVRLGLGTRLSDDPRTDALALGAEIAGRNPEAVRAAKALLNEAGLVSLEQGYLDESRRMGGIIGGPNQREAVTAALEDRPPRFTS